MRRLVTPFTKSLRCWLTAVVRCNHQCVHTTAICWRLGQPMQETHPHLLGPLDLTPGTKVTEYTARRERLVAAMPAGSAIILPSHPRKMMAHDIPFAFRQETNFHFLTGMDEADCIMCLVKGQQGEVRFILLVQPKDAEHELWHGPRVDVDTAFHFKCDEAYTVNELGKILSMVMESLGPKGKLYYHAGVHEKMDATMMKAFFDKGIKSYIPAGPLMQEVRRYKSPADIQMFQKAADISEAAFRQAYRATRPGLSEHHIFNVMEFEVRLHGAQRLAYPPVVAGGVNGLALHYINNTQLLRDGDLLLVDAGAEYHYYTSDVTRTWPVNGRFSPAQKLVYEAVLDVNEHIIAANIGNKLSRPAIHSLSVRLLVEKLIDLRVLHGSVDANVQRGTYNAYYPHAIGHPMGWDIHEQEFNSTGPNMIVTVEPGLYLPVSDAVPKEFRGIAVRIEDNIVLTEDVPIVLTRNIPKTVDEIESVMAEGHRDPLAEYVSRKHGF